MPRRRKKNLCARCSLAPLRETGRAALPAAPPRETLCTYLRTALKNQTDSTRIMSSRSLLIGMCCLVVFSKGVYTTLPCTMPAITWV